MALETKNEGLIRCPAPHVRQVFEQIQFIFVRDRAGRRNAAADEFFSQSKTRTWATCQKVGAILAWATFHNVGCRTVAACIAV
jgi:hypothetical protein